MHKHIWQFVQFIDNYEVYNTDSLKYENYGTVALFICECGKTKRVIVTGDMKPEENQK
jgi:hypothetical protein